MAATNAYPIHIHTYHVRVRVHKVAKPRAQRRAQSGRREGSSLKPDPAVHVEEKEVDAWEGTADSRGIVVLTVGSSLEFDHLKLLFPRPTPNTFFFGSTRTVLRRSRPKAVP